MFDEPGPITERWVAALLTTLIAPEVPCRAAWTVSAAVMVCDPIVISVNEKLPVPLVRAEFAGSVACASLLVNFTVPP